MQLVKTISLIPQSFFSDSDAKYLEVAAYTEIDRFTKIYVDPNRALYIYRDNNRLIGFVDAEFKQGIVDIAFAVSANSRMRGIGTQIMQLFLGLPEVEGLQVQAYVDEANVASIKLLKKLKFAEKGRDKDGLIRYVKFG